MARKGKPKPRNQGIVYLEGIGGGLSLLALWDMFRFPQFYWYGVGLLYVGFLTLAIGALIERWRIGWRLLACGIWLGIAILLSFSLIFVPASLDVVVDGHRGDYAVGANVHGIKWERGLTELRIIISNHTTNDYEDLDIYFTPNVATRAVAQVTNVPDVSLSLVFRGEDVLDLHMEAVDKSGAVEKPSTIYASSSGFRLRCPKLAKETTLDLLVALVNPDAQPTNKNSVAVLMLYGDDVNRFAGAKVIASRVYLTGQYKVLDRPHLVNYTQGVLVSSRDQPLATESSPSQVLWQSRDLSTDFR